MSRNLHPRALVIAVVCLACSQPRPGSTVSDGPPAPPAGGAPDAPPAIPADAPPARPADAPPADARAADTPPPVDAAPGPCRTDNGTDSCGVCQRCQGGACVAIGAGQTDDSLPATCGDDRRCDGKGACLGMIGRLCGRSDECLSGFCRSSVCCDSDCAGSCRHCLMPGRAGTCIDATGPSPAIGCTTNSEICLAANRCLDSDQSCAQYLSPITTDGDPIAQTFTASRNGRLVAVRVALVCQEQQEATLEIRAATAASPEGQLLASQTLRGPTTLADVIVERWLVPLATPVPVRAGDRLSLIVRFRGPPFCSMASNASLCYSGGQTYIFRGDPPAWQADPDSDLGFRTYVAE